MKVGDKLSMPQYQFVVKEKLHDYHCDKKNKLKLGYLLKLIEEASTEHLISINLPYTVLFEEGIVFLMSKMAVNIFRRPFSGEEIVLKTASQGAFGAQFLRQIIIETAAGEPIAEAISSWFIAEPATRRVLKPDAFKHPLPTVPPEQKLTTVNSAHRIKPEGETVLTATRKVYYSDLDVNGHMNNTVYADVVTDHIPAEVQENMEPVQYFIAYKNEALLGNTLNLETKRSNNNNFFINCQSGDKTCFTAQIVYK